MDVDSAMVGAVAVAVAAHDGPSWGRRPPLHDSPAYAVQVCLTALGKVEIDDDVDGLDVDSTREQVCMTQADCQRLTALGAVKACDGDCEA